MQSETDLVPYASGRLDGSPVLVLAPHPDDEVFGCGGVLVQAVRSGAEVRVVTLTDGGAQGDPEERRREASEAASRLGVPVPERWVLADRSLEPADEALAERLRALLLEVRPAVLLAPSPAEIHPDHRALALAVYRVLQRAAPGSELHAAVQAVRLAAYEVSAVLRPNLLVDVSDVWEDVLAAAKAYASQVGVLPYVEVMEGLAAARRLTLPAGVRRAEAYYVADLRYIRTHSAAEWAAAQGPTAQLEESAGSTPLDVVVRTKDRPQLLAQALDSLTAQLVSPARIIVVNDGGLPVGEVCSAFADRLPLEVMERVESEGRAAAAQRGLEKSSASHVVFLDDDDRFLPEHLLVLGRAVTRGVTAPYTDAVQGVWQPDGEGGWRLLARHRTFGGDFDRDRLRLVNFIPLPTVALPRELVLEVGGFDTAMDLYEDWDLLLRLAERTPLVHLPVVTCEYRVLAGTGAITAANPPGSSGQLAALAAVWRRNGLFEDEVALARAVMSLVAERDRQAETARGLDERLVEVTGERDGLRARVVRMGGEGTDCEALQAEVDRLNGILDQIYSSRTWKLHRLLERGRGEPEE